MSHPRYLALILGFFFVPTTYYAQTKTLNESTITPCRWEIAAPVANFRMAFGYLVEVGPYGKISKITQVSNSQRGLKMKFVRDEVFVSCMEKWRLEPEGSYYVSFYVGTTSIGTKEDGPANYMRIVDPNKNSLKIELFLADSDTLVVEEKRP